MEASTRHHTFPKGLHAVTAATVLLWIAGCGGKLVTYEQQLLTEADSLFHAGNFEYAKVKYDKIRTLKPSTPAACNAQYYLGYINIYYENPFANWEAALREFKLFVSLYPEDARVDEVNSWIKLLVVMKSFKKEFLGTSKDLDSLKMEQQNEKSQSSSAKTAASIDVLSESLRSCTHVRDSLDRKSKDLENFILDLVKKCQAAGQ